MGTRKGAKRRSEPLWASMSAGPYTLWNVVVRLGTLQHGLVYTTRAVVVDVQAHLFTAPQASQFIRRLLKSLVREAAQVPVERGNLTVRRVCHCCGGRGSQRRPDLLCPLLPAAAGTVTWPSTSYRNAG